MKKHHFDISKIVSITITLESDSGYRWAPAIPERPKKFLGIRIGTKPAVPAGWTLYSEADDLDWAYYRRMNSSYFSQYKSYKVDELNKKVMIKPSVELKFECMQTSDIIFETDAEAQAWVNALLATSDKKFTVITNTRMSTPNRACEFVISNYEARI